MRAYAVNHTTQCIYEIFSKKTVYFGKDFFIDSIVRNKNCFICGATNKERHFNDEHIISNWILRHCSLHSETINLPNGTTFRYGSYTVPCCKQCNSLLGKLIEIPVSNLLKLPFSRFIKELSNNLDNETMLWKFMALIFFKTHLKDSQLKMHLDPRNGSGVIGDLYDWESLHHVHCIVRSPFVEPQIEDSVVGSLFILPAISHGPEDFDYIDNFAGQTAMLQIGPIAIIAVFNDSKAAQIKLENRLSLINAPLSKLQLRQILSDVISINRNLKERPVYLSTIVNNTYTIQAKLPENIELVEWSDGGITPGELLAWYADNLLPPDFKNREETLELIREHRYNYLFDDNQKFINLSPTITME